MKAATHSLAADQGTTGQRASRLAQAAVDNRPQAVAQRQLQQQLDGQRAGTPSAFSAAASPPQPGSGVVQRVDSDDEEAQQPAAQSSWWSRGLAGVSSVGSGLYNAASSVGTGLYNGVSSVGNGLYNGASSVGSGLYNGASWLGNKVADSNRFVMSAPWLHSAMGGAHGKPKLPVRLLTKDTPGPTGGLGMLSSLATSGTTMAAGIYDSVAKTNVLQSLAPGLSLAQNLTSGYAALNDVVGMAKTSHKLAMRPDAAKTGKRLRKIGLRGLDLTGNGLQIAANLTGNPLLGLAGSAVGSAVQGYVTKQGIQGGTRKARTGAASTGTGLANNVYSLGQSIGTIVAGKSDAANNFFNSSPNWLQQVNAQAPAALGTAISGATTAMTLYDNWDTVKSGAGKAGNALSQPFKATYKVLSKLRKRGEQQPLLYVV